MIDDPTALLGQLEAFLARQGWFQSAIGDRAVAALSLEFYDVLLPGPPGLGRVILARGDQHFQVLIGWRSNPDLANDLRHHESALIGTLGVGVDQLVVYDALADDVLCSALLEMSTGGRESAKRVRSVSSLTSHASLVFDDRLFMKCYRVLEEGERNEVVTAIALDEVGFNALPGPMGRLRAHDFDLTFVREYLPSALEGRSLALTSLRDLLAYGEDDDVLPTGTRRNNYRVDRSDPRDAARTAGGDLASESYRLGQTIARLHLALRDAFGQRPLDLSLLRSALSLPVPPRSVLGFDREPDLGKRIAESLGRREHKDLGHAIRLHGELHLRRVMRSEPGWLITGFSDDPLYRLSGQASSLEARTGSPIEDLADTFFSIELVAKEALSQRSDPSSSRTRLLAQAWANRNQEALLNGYLSTPGLHTLLPEEALIREDLLRGYQLLRQRVYEATFSEVSS